MRNVECGIMNAEMLSIRRSQCGIAQGDAGLRPYSAFSIQHSEFPRPYTVLVSRSHRTPEVDEYINKVLRPVHPDLVIDTQGSSLKFARLAEGSADVDVCYSKTKEWDTAAADAILRAAGGKVLRISDGKPLEYSKAEYPNPPFVAWAAER